MPISKAKLEIDGLEIVANPFSAMQRYFASATRKRSHANDDDDDNDDATSDNDHAANGHDQGKEEDGHDYDGYNDYNDKDNYRHQYDYDDNNDYHASSSLDVDQVSMGSSHSSNSSNTLDGMDFESSLSFDVVAAPHCSPSPSLSLAQSHHPTRTTTQRYSKRQQERRKDRAVAYNHLDAESDDDDNDNDDMVTSFETAKSKQCAPSKQSLSSCKRNTVDWDACRRTPGLAELDAASRKNKRAFNDTVAWYGKFNELIDYAKEHDGDCNVPQKYQKNPQLGIWINKQRMEKKFLEDGQRSSMTQERIEALESIGFCWAKRKGDSLWMRHFAEMQAYKKEHGHCNVPVKFKENPPLGRWVSTQRTEYKLFMTGQATKHMTQFKVDLLNSLGFVWGMVVSTSSSVSPSKRHRKYYGRLTEDQRIFVWAFYASLRHSGRG